SSLPAQGSAGRLTLIGSAPSAATVIPMAADGSAGEPLTVDVPADATVSLTSEQLQVGQERAAGITIVPEVPGAVHAGWTQRDGESLRRPRPRDPRPRARCRATSRSAPTAPAAPASPARSRPRSGSAAGAGRRSPALDARAREGSRGPGSRSAPPREPDPPTAPPPPAPAGARDAGGTVRRERRRHRPPGRRSAPADCGIRAGAGGSGPSGGPAPDGLGAAGPG